MASGLQVADAAFHAGLRGEALVTSIAVSKAESKFDENVLGDQSLQDSKWGPSVGAWQIRTLKAETGTGGDRDLQALRGNLQRQADSMFRISNGGTNWQPWTMFTNGVYRQFMDEARQLALNAGAGGTGPGGPMPNPAPGAGGFSLSDAFRDSIERVIGMPIPELAIRTLEVFAGAGVIAIGVVMFIEVVSTPGSREAGGVISRTTRKAASFATGGVL